MREIGVHINWDKCILCDECAGCCIHNAITWQEGKLVIDRNECTLCEECVDVCPDEALYLIMGNGEIKGDGWC